jgi:hypothetical protein
VLDSGMTLGILVMAWSMGIADAWAEPVAAEVTKSTQSVRAGTVEFLVPIDANGRVLAKRSNFPSFIISEAGLGQAIMCDYIAGKGHAKKVWAAWGDFFQRLSEVTRTSDQDFKKAKKGVVGFNGSTGVGYCNATAIARNGVISVFFARNSRCTGTGSTIATCETTDVTVALEPSEAAGLAFWFKDTADRM